MGRYFADHGDAVAIEDASVWLSERAENLIDEPVTDDAVG
ncbi:hypothetical protein X757_07195 [Mesorhizobium sp. LSHC414A00]|nr:hypothetical protein X757_07195 [Mesorhizobium sp. LSHC414A00]